MLEDTMVCMEFWSFVMHTPRHIDAWAAYSFETWRMG